ncbi:MAG: O-antigen ligase family protein [Bacteroidota bacterium]|nr:MAG: O-antigen ligase family protein [Bacteroidota bacterium]
MLPLIKQYKKELGLVLLSLAYLVVNMVFTYHGFLLLNLLPVALLLIYLAFVRLDIIYFIIIGFTPLSVPLLEFVRGTPIDFYMPTEPLLFGIMLIVIYRSVQQPFLDRRVLNHPVSLAILFNLFWLVFTTVTSSMPLVSLKYVLARIWFLTTFYLLAIYLFKDTRNIYRMLWAYVLPLLIVIGYAWSRHWIFGLRDREAAHWVMNPFYRDHTSYGAVLAMLLFPYIGINMVGNRSLLRKASITAVGLILFIALIFSYTRAAWISIFVSLFVWTVVKLRIKFKFLVLAGMFALFVAYLNQPVIIKMMERNEKESSENLAEHLQSVTNIATDESNLERINRWASAFRMFKERPVLGWGPGTYMFQYAPFQHSSQRTSISTNFGDGGNAHSEYIGPLAESGVLGTISFVLIIVAALVTAFSVYRKIEKKRIKGLVLAVTLGFITYLFHGLLNNFLDTDKASSLFWGYIAVFVSLDLYYLPKQQERKKIAETEA